MKKCPRCGYENPDDAYFCLNCHYPLGEGIKVCPRCGFQNPPDASFCQKCHYPLVEIKEIGELRVEEEKERIPTEIFRFWFIFSLLYISSILLFSIIPLFSVILNVISTLFFSISIYKLKSSWYYYLANLSPLGLYLLLTFPFAGVFIFSLGGFFISDLFRIVYIKEKDQIFFFISIILLIGYLGGLFFTVIYNITLIGYILLFLESIKRITKREK